MYKLWDWLCRYSHITYVAHAFWNVLLYVGVQLINNIVLVSGGPQNASVYTYVRGRSVASVMFDSLLPYGLDPTRLLQARLLEWAAIPSRGSSQPRDWTHVSFVSCIAGRFFTAESSFTWFYIFFSSDQVLLPTLSWCSARSSVSEGIFLMYPWRETDSMSTYSSAILFPSTSLLFNHWIVFHCTSGYVAILLCIHWLKLLISTVRLWKCILAQNLYPKEPHICIQLWSTGLIPVWLGILG